jgi:formyltetrahydrofolate hydrolase
MATTRLLLSCPDRPGIAARVAGTLADADRNIIDADQHSTDEGKLFMRLVFESAPESEHRDEVPDLIRIGRDLERLVLARAVRGHLEDRVLVDGERTVVF